MGAIASQITSLTIVYSIVYSGADQRKHESSASLAFVRGIHRRPVNSPHKWPVTRKQFPFDDVIMSSVVILHTSATYFSRGRSGVVHVPIPLMSSHINTEVCARNATYDPRNLQPEAHSGILLGTVFHKIRHPFCSRIERTWHRYFILQIPPR